MEDKEVGELWTELNYRHSGESEWLFVKAKKLIRKLVQERYESYDLAGYPTPLEAVLGELGINQETWKK